MNASKEKKGHRGLRITAIVLACFFGFLIVAVSFFLAADAICIQYARTLPSYERIDIGALLEQEEWSDEDYETLYLQTGLGRSSLDSLKDDPERILSFQEALFYEGEVVQDSVSFGCSHDEMADNYNAPLAPLERGDVIVTSSCHTFGWRNGHSALVLSSSRVLESVSPGYNSSIGSVSWFSNAANFIILRLKDASAEERSAIADWANEKLYNVPYSLTVGIFSAKDQGDDPVHTHCSHLVWQAYKHFGYDIDSDGGPVVTSRDIANCDLFEIVQVNGFDPIELW